MDIIWPTVSNVHKEGLKYLRINSADDLKIETSNDSNSFNFWNSSLNEFSSFARKVNDEL